MYRLLLLAACESAATPPAVISSHVDPPPPKTCVTDVLADGDTRSQMRGKAVQPVDPEDLDGDGTPDVMYETPEIGGNRDVYLYASDHGCTHYAGSVHVSFLSMPHCVEPARPGAICRLSAMRYMIHGDEYEYFFTCSGGKCSEAGTGRHVVPPPGGP
jgi:hypothetical protein